MIETDALYEIIENEGILLAYNELPKVMNGTQYFTNGLGAILIDSRIISDERLYRTVLSEEIGHYFTSYGEHATKRKLNHRFKVRYEKVEQAAVRWGADFLIPTQELLEAINGMHPPSLADLASTFMVTESLVQTKLEIMAAQTQCWLLSDGRKLVLTNLPDIYLYEAF